IIEKRRCCSRPMISKALLSQAKANAAHNVSLLAPYARRGIPIVGCEPSCILTIRDDYPDLVPGDDAQIVAEQTTTFEEFIVGGAHPQKLEFDAHSAKVLIHGHCHQKSLVGFGPSYRALDLIPETQIGEIPSGCCGMAGSF